MSSSDASQRQQGLGEPRPPKRSRNGNLIHSGSDPSGFEFSSFNSSDVNQEEVPAEGSHQNWNWSWGSSFPASNPAVKVESGFQENFVSASDLQDTGVWSCLLSSSFLGKQNMSGGVPPNESMQMDGNPGGSFPAQHSSDPSSSSSAQFMPQNPSGDVQQTSGGQYVQQTDAGAGSSGTTGSTPASQPPGWNFPPSSSSSSTSSTSPSVQSATATPGVPSGPPGGSSGGSSGLNSLSSLSTMGSSSSFPTPFTSSNPMGGVSSPIPGAQPGVGPVGAQHLHSTKSFHSNPDHSLSSMSERTSLPVIKSLLPQISQVRTEILAELGRLKTEIGQFKPSSSMTSDSELIKNFTKRLTETKKLIEWAATQIQGLYQTYLLPPEDIYALMSTHTDLFVRLKQLQVYQMEVGHMSHFSEISEKDKMKCDHNKPFGTLVIARQPFPKPLKQNTRASAASEDPTEVLLLHGARMSIVCPTTIKAELVYEEYHQKGCNFTMQGDVQELDDNNTATFSEIRFSRGTRLKMVRLQFMADVKFKQYGQMSSIMLESDPSSPFIIMTNESQWDFSEGILFKKDAFTRNEISWVQFSNILQMHYIRATRQDPEVPERPLSMHDLLYIFKSQFGEREVVTQKDFDRFWKWFGKVLHKIRHQKPFCQLWLKGLIFGFISKPDAEEVLKNQPHGTFIIRFSERVAGKMAIAYNRLNESTKEIETSHYLIAPHDKKETVAIPDFLSQNENFIYVLKLRTDFDAEMLYSKPRQRVIGRTHKNEALAEYYTKKISQKGLEGYENTSHTPSDVGNVLDHYDDESDLMHG
eukprot:CAMPEP_0201486210 /NCGR_PEP_ID=MMETSP0151_2-20130828/10275_1 /ASSEMBLY_ACC=CAM_ASM_000257 /TAXON_ID=200890 /ORGANISM="Paramoeba atlantica, Strain 621/1 / CCAP 1560/9" /LENGTH=808 /DNA_ID=CAMNT_0047870723 /DNA_START=109 /DNA_END=2535 /DNA_ORIENTATION=-